MLAQTALTMPLLGERFSLRCTRRYGATFKLNLYWLGELVVTSDLELIRELFVMRKDGQPLATWIPGGSLRRMVGENPLTRTDGEDHRRNRRRMSDPLRVLVHGHQNDRSFLADDIREAFERLPVGGKHSLWSVIEPVLANGVLRDALGIGDPSRRRALQSAFTEYHALGHRPELFDERLRRLVGWKLEQRFDAAERTIGDLVTEELKATPAQGFRAGLLEFARAWARDIGADEEAMCTEFVKGIVYASTKTTTSACTWALLLLAHHPALLARLRRELGEDGRSLLTGCIREALRLFPPHPLTPVRRLTEAFSWRGVTLPQHAVLGVATSRVHRDPSVYVDPNRFLPDRYNGWNPPPQAWLPFGTGLHRCLGQHWALARAAEVVRTVVDHVQLVPARACLEPVGMIQQAHGPRWGGEVLKLGLNGRR
jgi:cytochrome P450